MSIRVVPYKHYDPEVKLHLAQLMLRGEQSPSALSRQYQVCRTLLYQWRDRYQEQGSQAFLRRRAPSAPVLKQAVEEIGQERLEPTLSQRLAQSERLCGQQAARIERLEQECALLKKAWHLLPSASDRP